MPSANPYHPSNILNTLYGIGPTASSITAGTAAPEPASGAGGYNLLPQPTSGRGAFGLVPGTIGVPPNRYEGVQSIYPNISGLTGGAGNIIQSEMAGELSPETINTIQDEAARFGLASGLPLSGLSGNRGLRSLGLSVEGRQRQGLQDYGSFLGTLAPLTTDPNLAASIAQSNAILNASPNPAMAANEQWRRYMEAANMAAAAGRTPAGGTGAGQQNPYLQLYGGTSPAGGTVQPGRTSYTPSGTGQLTMVDYSTPSWQVAPSGTQTPYTMPFENVSFDVGLPSIPSPISDQPGWTAPFEGYDFESGWGDAGAGNTQDPWSGWDTFYDDWNY